MLALAKQGCRGRSPPAKEERCHPEAASADRLAAEGSRADPIYKGGAVPLRRSLLCIHRGTWFSHPSFTQIIILRIDRTNEIAFLLLIDPFEGFFSCYCFVYIVVFFIVHQFVDVIPCGISEFVHFVFVFLIAAYNVVCNTHVKNTISFVCFNVNVICFCVHSDYIWWYNFVFWFTSDFFVQTPRRPCKWGRHEILRAPSGLRTRPQDDIVTFAGASPLHPVLRVRT